MCFIFLLYLGLVICRNDQAEDVNVLWPDLKVFLDFQDENYEELADLIDLKNFRHEKILLHILELNKIFMYWNFSDLNGKFTCRDNEHLSQNVNKESARAISWGDLKSLVEQNPTLQDKLIFPRLNKSGLLSIITLICPNPGKKTSIKVINSLFFFFPLSFLFHFDLIAVKISSITFFRKFNFLYELCLCNWSTNIFLTCFLVGRFLSWIHHFRELLILICT